jgi:RNA polymerase sigma factor (sigma-70 family)
VRNVALRSPLTPEQLDVFQSFLAEYGTPMKLVLTPKVRLGGLYLRVRELGYDDVDVEQELMCRTADAARTWQRERKVKFVTYLVPMLRSQFYELIRYASVQRRGGGNVPASGDAVAWESLPDDREGWDGGQEAGARVAKALTILDPRSREVVERRYGIGCAAPESLHSIGGRIGLTKERVRQIEEKALVRMRRIAERGDV